MSDRHICKAKRTDNGEWAEGYYIKDEKDASKAYIGYLLGVIDGVVHDVDIVEVDPSTICQCTGLTDKNGRTIWENDIVIFKHGGEFSEKGIYFRNYAVEFVNTYVTYGLRLRNKSIHFPFKQATASMHDVEVIGNIFDNQELLKGGAE